MEDFEAEQARVMELFAPHFSTICAIFDDAVSLYNTDTTPRARAEHDNRAATSAIYRHVWMGFERAFGEAAGVNFLDARGLHVCNYRDIALFRAKKVDANGRHVNNQTQQQRDFDRQLPLPDFPPAAVRLVIGYQPDLAFSCVERVIIRRPMGQWASQIIMEDEVATWIDITPAQLPFNPGRRANG